MKKELNRILLNRKQAMMVEKNSSDNWDVEYKKALVATASANLEALGCYMSSELATELLDISVSDILSHVDFMEKHIIHQLGSDVEYHPLYPSFPKSVMERTNAQLYFDALAYAMSGFTVVPYDPILDNKKKIESIAENKKKMKPIHLGSMEMIKEIASNLMASPVAFSPSDKEDILTIAKNVNEKEFQNMIPEKIPNKENLTWLAAEFMKDKDVSKNPFTDKMKSAIDVLRLIVARNDGDTSLSIPVKFRSLPKTEIRTYVSMLMKCKDVESSMYQYSSLFKKINETYHLRSIKNKEWQTLLDKLYAKDLERTFLSKRDAAIKNNNYSELISLYRLNPGQMGADLSRLAYLTLEQEDYALAKAMLKTALEKNSKKMATSNLLKADALIHSKLEKKKFNVYSPKKGIADLYMKVNEKEALPEDLVTMISSVIRNTLAERYKEKRPLGKVYIEEGLKDIKLPSQQRMASEGSVGLSYGSKFPVDEKDKHLRAFIWWTNSKSKKDIPIDIDLRASFYDKDFKYLSDISYYNLKDTDYGIHSGDVRDGGPSNGSGVAEFIDVDFDKLCKNTKARYVLFDVNMYYGLSFADTPCKFGWMESDKSIDKLFDVSKVEHCVNVNTNSKWAACAAVDVLERKVIWIDRPVRSSRDGIYVKNVYTSKNTSVYMDNKAVEVYRTVNNSIPDMYTLYELHAKARGEIVTDPKEADTLFTVERVNAKDYPSAKEFVSAYDNDLIVGDLIPDTLSAADKSYFEEKEKEEMLENEMENTKNEEER